MPSDAELAVAAAGGDRDALAAIYDRYADTLYELCRVILRDQHEASDAVQDTFVIAATRLSGLREPDRLKPWLCAIARREAIRRSSKRARNRPSHDEVLDVPVNDNAGATLMADDAASLVWEAAEALTERERAILVLNVRHGLEGSELADAAGMPGPQASVVLSRAKSQLAVAVRCTLLLRNGRADCAELAAIAPHVHAALDGLTRKRVARHAESCEICEPKWNSSPNALGILAAAPLLGAPAALKSKVLDDPRLISTSRPLGGRGWKRDGFPPSDDGTNRRLFTSIAAALLFIIVASALVLAGNNDSPKLRGPDADDSTTTFASPDTTLPGVGDNTSTSARRTTTTLKKTTPTTTKPGGTGGTTTPPTTAAPTTTTTIPKRIVAGANNSTLSTCGSPEPKSTMVHATATGVSGELLLRWREPGGSRFASGKNMQGSAANASAVLGPFSSGGQAEWWVTSADGTVESAHHFITVNSCSTPVPQ